MSEIIGFNITEANNLINTVISTYKSLASKVTEGWPSIKSTMTTNWVGESELECEKQLTARLVELDGHVHNSISDLVKLLKTLGNAYIEYETTAYLQTSVNGTMTDATLPESNVPGVVKYIDRTISEGTTRGVTSGGDATIKTALSTYINEVKSIAIAAANQISAASAFPGTQSSSIDNYISAIMNGVARVETCVKTIYTALGEAVKGHQETAAEVARMFSDAASNVTFDTQGDELDV